jgi:acylpyruvate hydrolase
VTFERRPERSTTAAESWRAGERGSPTIGDRVDFDTEEFSEPGPRRLGAVVPPGPHAGDIVDLNRALAMKLASEDAGAPEAEADSFLPIDMRRFLAHGEPSIRAAEAALAWSLRTLQRFDAPDLIRAGVVLPRRRVRLHAPVPRPGKIIGVARNYPAHAAERGDSKPPEEPILFIKASSSVIGDGADIVLPRASKQVDYEGELAVVIGRSTCEVSELDALRHVAGYTVANDVSARDFQGVRGQRFLGKSCDTFAPLGPVLVTPNELGDANDLALRTTVSGEVRQTARTKEMCFSVAQVIAFASRLMTLEPGDVLLMGTPSGVGAASNPPRWLRDGDVVDVEIERIGRLRNSVRAATD